MRHLSLVLCPCRHGIVLELILHFCICSAGPGPFLLPLQAGLWLWETQIHILFSSLQSCKFLPLGSSFSHSIQKYMWGFFFLHTSKTFPWTCELYSSVQSPSRWTVRDFCLPALLHSLLILLQFQRLIFHPPLSVLFSQQFWKDTTMEGF